jgi:Peptidase family M23
MRISSPWVGTALLLVAALDQGQLQAEPTSPVASVIVARPLTKAVAVPTIDGRTHVVYELQIVNPSRYLVAIDSVEVVDAKDGKTLGRQAGPVLSQRLIMGGGESGPALGPAHSAYLLMDVALAPGTLPAALDHRFAITLQARATADDDHHGVPLPAGAAIGPRVSFVAARTEVDPRPAVIIAPPLRGERWLVANGCCAEANPHRMAIIAIDGTPYVPERFAIDFVQLDSTGRLFHGADSDLSSYAYFGAPIYSVADGTVVGAHDGDPEETPGRMPTGKTLATAAGNNVIVDIGGGRFAIYAHFKTGSIRVHVGQRVKQGDVLGLVGNSGNTSNPHLHFHVADRASVLSSVALPYAFTKFTDRGVLSGDLDKFFGGGSGVIEPGATSGAHMNQLPLYDHVVDFQ